MINETETLSNYLFISFMYEGTQAIQKINFIDKSFPLTRNQKKEEKKLNGYIQYENDHFTYCATNGGFFSDYYHTEVKIIIDSVNSGFQNEEHGFCQWYTVIFYLADKLNFEEAQKTFRKFKINKTDDQKIENFNNLLIYDFITTNYETINMLCKKNVIEIKKFYLLDNIIENYKKSLNITNENSKKIFIKLLLMYYNKKNLENFSWTSEQKTAFGLQNEANIFESNFKNFLFS